MLPVRYFTHSLLSTIKVRDSVSETKSHIFIYLIRAKRSLFIRVASSTASLCETCQQCPLLSTGDFEESFSPYS